VTIPTVTTVTNPVAASNLPADYLSTIEQGWLSNANNGATRSLLALPNAAAGSGNGLITVSTTIDGSITISNILGAMLAGQIGKVTNSFNPSTHTLTTAYYRQDGVTVAYTTSTVYSSGALAPAVNSRTGTLGTLP
jgi:hypothetical protein